MRGYAEEPIVLIYSLGPPNESDNWMWGRKFTEAVKEPVEAIIIPDNDQGVLMPFYNTPQIMRKDMYHALQNAGVSNIDIYRAVVKYEDGRIVSEDYVAYNIIGLIKACDMVKTQFAEENPSRLIDASIEILAIDESIVKDHLIFRLYESFRMIIVHASVKSSIESNNIPCVIFQEMGNPQMF